MSLQPGRELDALVAVHVMDLKKARHKIKQEVVGHGMMAETCSICGANNFADTLKFPCVPSYSTDIAAAWTVVEKLQAQGKSLCMHWDAHELNKSFYIANHIDGLTCRGFSGLDLFEVESDSAAHAVCLAALKAMEASR